MEADPGLQQRPRDPSESRSQERWRRGAAPRAERICGATAIALEDSEEAQDPGRRKARDPLESSALHLPCRAQGRWGKGHVLCYEARTEDALQGQISAPALPEPPGLQAWGEPREGLGTRALLGDVLDPRHLPKGRREAARPAWGLENGPPGRGQEGMRGAGWAGQRGAGLSGPAWALPGELPTGLPGAAASTGVSAQGQLASVLGPHSPGASGSFRTGWIPAPPLPLAKGGSAGSTGAGPPGLPPPRRPRPVLAPPTDGPSPIEGEMGRGQRPHPSEATPHSPRPRPGAGQAPPRPALARKRLRPRARRRPVPSRGTAEKRGFF